MDEIKDVHQPINLICSLPMQENFPVIQIPEKKKKKKTSPVQPFCLTNFEYFNWTYWEAHISQKDPKKKKILQAG